LRTVLSPGPVSESPDEVLPESDRFITRTVLGSRYEDAKQAPEKGMAKLRRSAIRINSKNASAATTGVEGRKKRLWKRWSGGRRSKLIYYHARGGQSDYGR